MDLPKFLMLVEEMRNQQRAYWLCDMTVSMAGGDVCTMVAAENAVDDAIRELREGYNNGP